MKSHSPHLTDAQAARLDARIRVTPDFPKLGILFRDLSDLMADDLSLFRVIETMCTPHCQHPPSHVAGIESRGFIFGAAIARRLGCGFLMIRKAGKLPPPVDCVTYALEYGEAALELPRGAVKAGDTVLVVDDVLATGGTAGAAAKLLRQQGAEVVGFEFAVELDGLLVPAAVEGTARGYNAVLTY